MKYARVPSIVSRRVAAGLLVLAATVGWTQDAPARWPAQPDELTVPEGDARPGGTYTVARTADWLTLHLDVPGRAATVRIPAASATFSLPLGPEVRLRDPWATLKELAVRKPLDNLGWNVWDGRPASVLAAAAGTVQTVRIDPRGTVIEVDHGYGLRTRYLLTRFGASLVAAGARVAAGEPIAELEVGLPDDIPFVHMGVLFDSGQGLLALDPAPFFFSAEPTRSLPFATSVLNAAVRSGDQTRTKQLLALGLDPNRPAMDRTLPLEWAILMRDADMVRLLAAAGGDRNARTSDRVGYWLPGEGMTIANTGPTILQSAYETNDPELVTALIGR